MSITLVAARLGAILGNLAFGYLVDTNCAVPILLVAALAVLTVQRATGPNRGAVGRALALGRPTTPETRRRRQPCATWCASASRASPPACARPDERMTADGPVEPWELVESEQLEQYRITRVRRDRRRSPRTGAEHDFYVLQMAEWVNVVAVTRNGQILVIEQFRHGTQEVSVEIPGGVVDPEDGDDWVATEGAGRSVANTK